MASSATARRVCTLRPPTTSGGGWSGEPVGSRRAGVVLPVGYRLPSEVPDSEIDMVVEEAKAAVASGALETL
jgi:hypothetical protein